MCVHVCMCFNGGRNRGGGWEKMCHAEYFGNSSQYNTKLLMGFKRRKTWKCMRLKTWTFLWKLLQQVRQPSNIFQIMLEKPSSSQIPWLCMVPASFSHSQGSATHPPVYMPSVPGWNHCILLGLSPWNHDYLPVITTLSRGTLFSQFTSLDITHHLIQSWLSTFPIFLAQFLSTWPTSLWGCGLVSEVSASLIWTVLSRHSRRKKS